MSYTVRASTQASDSEWSFDDALEATKKANELLANGVQGLTVDAPGGRSYRDDELDQMLSIAEVTDNGRT